MRLGIPALRAAVSRSMKFGSEEQLQAFRRHTHARALGKISDDTRRKIRELAEDVVIDVPGVARYSTLDLMKDIAANTLKNTCDPEQLAKQLKEIFGDQAECVHAKLSSLADAGLYYPPKETVMSVSKMTLSPVAREWVEAANALALAEKSSQA